tara:strand:- start:1125 stop:1685 length:561 start_codon:yes stop_codon:yes gene_type:complete
MKTVIDAVNKFEGNWPDDTTVIECSCFDFVCTKGPFNDLVSQMETNFGKCEQGYSDYKFDYHLSPEPTLTYTQAMADNGEFPSVGMECLVLYPSSNYAGAITYMGDGCGCFKEVNGKEYSFAINSVTFKPLTPPIELIDGKAYQFNYMNKTRVGYYCSDNDQLMFRGGWSRGSICTNIQPLTVEVK